MLGNRVDNFLIADKRNQEKSEPPAYEYQELVDRLNGSFLKFLQYLIINILLHFRGY